MSSPELVHPFVVASTWQRDTPGRYTTVIDPRWYQGRGAYGGVLAAGMLRSMMDVVGDARRQPRTLHVHFCAPAKEGAIELEVSVERTGASVMTLLSRLRQSGQVIALATATFAFPRVALDKARLHRRPFPDVPRPQDVTPLPVDVPLMPTFTQFFEYRFCVGSPPYSGSDDPRIGGWIRPRGDLALDAPLAAALMDAYPPSVLSLVDTPRAAATIDLTIDFHLDLPRASCPAGAHLLFVTEAVHGDGGTTADRSELWSDGGEHLASCRQLVIVL